VSIPFDPPEPVPGESPRGGGFNPHADDPFADPSAGEPAGPLPDPAAGDELNGPRPRHDAFTEAKKCAFLDALIKTGCILDASRAIGVSPRTIYRHQELDPRFFANCAAALRMSGTPVELTAWQRAVEGVEQEFACGGQVHVRRRYDGSLLRLLLQGSNPKKYGPRPGFKRKRILKHERKQMEREIYARLREDEPCIEEVREEVLRKVAAIQRQAESEKLASGWMKTPDGEWVPPGYGPLPGAALSAAAAAALHPGGIPAPGAEPPRDSMCQS